MCYRIEENQSKLIAFHTVLNGAFSPPEKPYALDFTETTGPDKKTYTVIRSGDYDSYARALGVIQNLKCKMKYSGVEDYTQFKDVDIVDRDFVTHPFEAYEIIFRNDTGLNEFQTKTQEYFNARQINPNIVFPEYKTPWQKVGI